MHTEVTNLEVIVDFVERKSAVFKVLLLVITLWVASEAPSVLAGGVWLVVIWVLPECAKLIDENARLTTMILQNQDLASSAEKAEAAFAERVQELEAQIEFLAADNANLQQELQKKPEKEIWWAGDPLYRKVGLDRDCPEWVARAVRREYRKRLHPDAHPEARKAEANRRFVAAEEIFEKIWRDRRFQ